MTDRDESFQRGRTHSLASAWLAIVLIGHTAMGQASAQKDSWRPQSDTNALDEARLRPGNAGVICRHPLSNQDLPGLELRHLSEQVAADIRFNLTHSCFDAALGQLFSKYRADLTDWVVYIDKGGTVYQGFNAAGNRSPVLRDQAAIYAVVLMDRRPTPAVKPKPDAQPSPVEVSVHSRVVDVDAIAPPAKDASGGSSGQSDTTDLLLGRRVVTFQRDPVVTLLIEVVGKGIGLSPAADPTATDSVRALRLEAVWGVVDTLKRPALPDTVVGDTLFAALGRFALVPNSQVDLSLVPPIGKTFGVMDVPAKPGELRAVYGSLANTHQPRLELGILAGMTCCRRIPTYNANQQITSETPTQSANGYLTVNFNYWLSEHFNPVGCLVKLWSPQTPGWQRAPAIGPFIGTNALHGSLGDEVAYGLQFGHLYETFGFAIGIDQVQVPTPIGITTKSGAVRRLIYGVDLRL